MRKIFCVLIIGLLGIGNSLTLKAQKFIRNKAITGVCYAGNKVTRISIPPPEEFYRKAGSKGGGSVTIYYTGFSNQGKAALDYAASILRSMLPSDTHLTIVANYEKISSTGVLAQTSVNGYVGGWGIDALNPVAFYPVALAEKIAGEKINEDSEGDLTLTVNSAINWYFGTDMNPGNKYDLVTVALHEICHGLGFYDSMNTDATTGWYGVGSIPMIYDTFVENRDGKRITDTTKFNNYSAELKTQFTTAPLYFKGPLLKYYSVLTNYAKSKAKLYVPSTWDPGSSVSHLDEDTFRLKDNALMTPYIDMGEAIHDPGKYTFSILADMGWINTRIIHKTLPDTEEHLSQLTLSATIKSDTLYKRNKVGLVYSFNKFLSSDSVYLNSPNSDNNFSASLTIPAYNTELQYYFYVEDFFSRLYRSPSYIKQFKHKVFIGTDTVKPVITHTPVKYYLQTVDSIKFNSTVTDNIGIDTVYIEYKVNDNPSRFIGLKRGTSDVFSTVFNAKPLSLKGGDSILYRIYAIDKAQLHNISVFPATGYFSIHIESVGSTLESYITDFTGAANNFFNDGFSFSKPSGFSKYGLHTKHPYESPEDNNKNIEYTSMLRNPLKFSESGMLINFNEIVLVEPGEPGSVFGSSGFYDYVIVEGSQNFGKSWFSLEDGYDSRLFPSWESAYNSIIVGQNSTFTGQESMLQKHTKLYRPSDKITAGDTLMLRFRLFSDPFANGWGWAIEDLKIRPLVDAVEKISSNEFKIYPNPGTGLIKIDSYISNTENGKPQRFSIFNSAGTCIVNNQIRRDTQTLIDISGNPTGIYIILLFRDDGVKAVKYTLIK